MAFLMIECVLPIFLPLQLYYLKDVNIWSCSWMLKCIPCCIYLSFHRWRLVICSLTVIHGSIWRITDVGEKCSGAQKKCNWKGGTCFHLLIPQQMASYCIIFCLCLSTRVASRMWWFQFGKNHVALVLKDQICFWLWLVSWCSLIYSFVLFASFLVPYIIWTETLL